MIDLITILTLLTIILLIKITQEIGKMSWTFEKFKKPLSNWFNDNTILDIYNLMIEFDRNKNTSNFKEFVKNYNEYKQEIKKNE